jgi:cytochrome bd-type quinol oxidase subunit 1
MGFLIVAFTPIVPLLLHTYDIDNEYVIKAIIGVISLICGYGMIWGLYKKENQVKEKKEGKMHVRIITLLIGITIIALAWFTDLPLMVAEYTGLSDTFTHDGETLKGGLGLRLFTTVFTATGVFMVKYSFYRRKEEPQRIDEYRYMEMLNDRRPGW